MTSYSNPFYDYMKRQKFKNGIAVLDGHPNAKLYLNQYRSYKLMTKKWRFNIKHVQIIKNRFIKKPFELLNKEMECKKL